MQLLFSLNLYNTNSPYGIREKYIGDHWKYSFSET